MSRAFDYTSLANRVTAQFPTLAYVGTQINFWVLANILLVTILHLNAIMINSAFGSTIIVDFYISLIVALAFGILYGAGIGMASYYLDKKYFKTSSLGRVLLIKTFTFIFILIILLLLLRGTLVFVFPVTIRSNVSEKLWNNLFVLLIVYYSFMSLVINFVNQMNKKFGPGVLIPLLLGQYRNPREEERIFMFMDLKSSTSTAEKLGHLKYSSFIRDCFMDINKILSSYNAQVYQYVGDEIVLMWPPAQGMKNNKCLKFYFACRKQFEDRKKYYLSSYGILPFFKAGLHVGPVTAVEIGDVKKDIAYHGDTLNTAARIQGLCNQFEKDLIASESLCNKIINKENFQFEYLGMTLVKGKAKEIGIVSVSEF